MLPILITNHSHSVCPKCLNHGRRQQCHLSYISEFTTDIRHIQGKDNLVADMLSRANVDSIQLGIDYCGMAADDPEVQALCTATSSLQVEDIPFGVQGVTLLCDTSTGHARPIVPAGWSLTWSMVYHTPPCAPRGS